MGPRRRQYRLRLHHGEPEHRPLRADPAHGRPPAGSGRDATARAGGQPAEPGQAPRRAAPAHHPSRQRHPLRARSGPAGAPGRRRQQLHDAGRLRVRERGAGSRRGGQYLRRARPRSPHPGQGGGGRRDAGAGLRPRVARGTSLSGSSHRRRRGGGILQARRRAHPHRLRSSTLPRGPPAPWRGLPVALQDHHRLHHRPQHHPRPRRAGRGHHSRPASWSRPSPPPSCGSRSRTSCARMRRRIAGS